MSTIVRDRRSCINKAGSGNATKGHEALKKMIVDTNARQSAAAEKGQPRQPMYHMTLNSKLTFVWTKITRVSRRTT
jgi:hypothetical protein